MPMPYVNLYLANYILYLNTILMQKFHIIYGKHAVLACIAGKRRTINNIYLQNDKAHEYKGNVPSELSNKVTILDKHAFEQKTKVFDKHQGIAASVSNYRFHNESSLKNCKTIFILDSVQDPHNLGAIIRSAYCFNIDAIIIQDKQSPDITSAVVRSSAGYSELTKIVKVVNISQTIEKLKKEDFWAIGLDSNATVTGNNAVRNVIADYKKKIFVFGSEGSGIRQLVLSKCDIKLKIPINKNSDSLNVSNAVAIIAYENYIHDSAEDDASVPT